MSWAAVIVGGVSLGLGVYQTVKGGQDKKKLKQPDSEIPEELKANQDIASQIAYEGLPASAKAEYNKQVQRSQAMMLSRSGELQSGIGAMAAGQIAAQDALSQFYVKDAQAKIAGKRMLMNANTAMSAAKNREFGIQENRYQQDLASSQAMIGAGIQNIGNSVGYGASAVASFLDNKDDQVDIEDEKVDAIDTTEAGSVKKDGKNSAVEGFQLYHGLGNPYAQQNQPSGLYQSSGGNGNAFYEIY